MPFDENGVYTPDESWLHGKYNFGHGDTGEINTKLPYVAVDLWNDGKGKTEFFAQGEEASAVITEIHTLWLQDGRRTTKTAFLKWINLYL